MQIPGVPKSEVAVTLLCGVILAVAEWGRRSGSEQVPDPKLTAESSTPAEFDAHVASVCLMLRDEAKTCLAQQSLVPSTGCRLQGDAALAVHMTEQLISEINEGVDVRLLQEALCEFLKSLFVEVEVDACPVEFG